MRAAIEQVYRLSAQDTEAMATIHAACFERSWSALDMSVHIQKDLCLGLGDPLTCFVILRDSGEDGEILTLATDPDRQRTGQAQKLLSQTHHRLAQKGLATLYLEVAEDNVAAQSLYRKMGYTPIGRRPGYYRRANGRMAAITFSRALADTPGAS